MTKDQLLADLLSKSFIDYVGTPGDPETLPDNTKVYISNCREISSEGVARYRNIAFYVVLEGTSEEAAYYKDVSITPTLPSQEFKNFVRTNYKSAVPEMVSYQWNSVDEVAKEGVVKGFVPDLAKPNFYTTVAYMVAEVGGALVMLPMSLSADTVVGATNG